MCAVSATALTRPVMLSTFAFNAPLPALKLTFCELSAPPVTVVLLLPEKASVLKIDVASLSLDGAARVGQGDVLRARKIDVAMCGRNSACVCDSRDIQI